MAASGVSQYSINVKSNLADFYGELHRSKMTLDELTKRKYKLEVDSSELDRLRDKSQKIALEIRDLGIRKQNIKANSGIFSNADAMIKRIDSQIRNLRQQKLEVDTNIQPIRTANVELHKVQQEIDRINNQRVDIKFSDSIKQAGSSIQNLGNKMSSMMSPLSSKMNDMFGMGLVVNGVDRAMSAIGDSIGAAANRVDTLNNFPKVMSNLNISTKDSKQAIDMLDNGLKGLPTTLDQGASAVQNFTASNNDVKKSTDIFLALNDAILAGGKSQEIQSSAMEQISQSYAKGKPDMVEWRSLVTAMPAQIAQVAKAMGMTQDELGEGLRKGDISMDDFMAKIVELDKKGGKGFKSFSEQAHNALGGVNTGMSLLKTSITRGVADIVNKVDESFKDMGMGGIAGVLGKVGSTFEDGLSYIGQVIYDNRKDIQEFATFIGDILKDIDYKALFDGFVDGMKIMADTIKGALTVLKPFFALFQNEGSAKTIGRLIPMWIGAATALKILGRAISFAGSTVSIGGKLFEFFGVASKLKMPAVFTRFKDIFGKSKDKGGELPLKKVSVDSIKALGMKLAAIAAISASLYVAAQAMKVLSGIDTDGIWEKLAALGTAIGGLGLIMVAVDKLMKVSKTSMGGVAMIVGISGSLYIAASALSKLNDVSGDFVGVQQKIASIALAVGEMGALAAVIGKLTTGGGIVTLGFGLAAIVGISGALWLASVSLGQLSKIELDAGKITQKIGAIVVAVTEFGVLAAAVGALMATGIGAVLVGAGTATILGIVTSALAVAWELNKLSSIELDTGKIGKVTSAIKTSLEDIMSINAGDGSNTYDKVVDFFEQIVNRGIVGQVLNIAKKLVTLQDMKLDLATIRANVTAVKDAISLMASINMDDESNALNKWFDNKENNMNVAIVDQLLAIASKLSLLQMLQLDPKTIGNSIAAIKYAIQQVSSMFSGDLQDVFKAMVDNMSAFMNANIIGNLTLIGQNLAALQGLGLDPKAINAAISSIKQAIQSVTSIFAGEDTKMFDQVVTLFQSFFEAGIMDNLLTVGQKLSQIQQLGLDPDKTLGQISVIKRAISSIMSMGDGSSDDNGGGFLNGVANAFTGAVNGVASAIDGGSKKFDMSQIVSIADNFYKVGQKLQLIQGLQLKGDTINNQIETIKKAIQSISNFAVGDIVNNLNGISDALNRMIHQLTEQFPPQFSNLGKLLAQKMSTAFKDRLNFKKAVSQRMREIDGGVASSAGRRLAKSLNSTFKDNLNLAGAIERSIRSALSQNYSTTIHVNTVTHKKSGKTVNAGGGLISGNHDSYVLQDSPEHPVLDNGEYVMTKKATRTLGPSFMSKINHLDPKLLSNLKNHTLSSPTFKAMGQSISNTTSNVINNFNNTTNHYQNDNRVVHQTVYANSGSSALMIDRRGFR